MLGELVARLRRLDSSGERVVIGLVGCPGAGKSTLAALLATSLDPDGDWVARVPMDGFHLADAALDRLGRRERKGAIDTFDARGYLSLLRRMRTERDDDIYAPDFERSLEQPIAGSIAVGPGIRLVLTEGNYLLADAAPWPLVRAELTEVWYVDLDDAVRRERLVTRHVRYGKTLDDARRWVDDVDEVNARLVAAGRARADLVVDMARLPSAVPA